MEVKIQALLELGEKPKDIAEKLGCGYQKVLSERKKMDAKRANRKIDDIVTIDPVALEIIVDKAKEEAPASVIKKLDRVAEGITGLQKLDGEFHRTFSIALSKANEFLEGEKLKPSEWVAITNALSAAYNNIYNNSGVNVHVDNSTQVSSNNLSMFKGAMRG